MLMMMSHGLGSCIIQIERDSQSTGGKERIKNYREYDLRWKTNLYGGLEKITDQVKRKDINLNYDLLKTKRVHPL